MIIAYMVMIMFFVSCKERKSVYDRSSWLGPLLHFSCRVVDCSTGSCRMYTERIGWRTGSRSEAGYARPVPSIASWIFALLYPSSNTVTNTHAGKPALDWSTRKRIAVGAARGLLYLHEQCDPKIIHRDVKAANVLLDEHHEAVVGDFGLAKLLDHGDSHVTTAVRGTVGHIAPEYLSTGQSSEKTDVFGFGILLLELVTGQRALEVGKGSGGAVQGQKGVMLDWVSNPTCFSLFAQMFNACY